MGGGENSLPELIRPRARAWAILPAPIKPILMPIFADLESLNNLKKKIQEFSL